MSNFNDLRTTNRLSFIWFMVTICLAVCSVYLIFERSGHAPDSVMFGLNHLLIGLTFGSGVVTAITKATQKLGK